MTKNIFMSYSRREVGFVDDLVQKLENKGYGVWLDYRNLIPGTPWQDQIYNGVRNADVILLVVSKASIVSQNVELEWRHVLEQGKRVVLLIFEAVDLPLELETYEWVDFRGSYKTGLQELFSQLQASVQKKRSVPQTGFKIPNIVWLAAMCSVAAAIMSLFAFWTLFIPWLLVPLPFRIFKRNFNFTRVQSALWILPVALFVSAVSASGEMPGVLLAASFASIPVVIAMIFILRSPGMQRWGKEQATMPVFANPLTPNVTNPASVSYYIDHAPQDRKIAVELSKTLKKYGHTQSPTLGSAQSVLALLSRFKSDTEADPEHQTVFPLILQTGKVSKKLSHIQWIDLRPGVRGLDTIAKLLPEPAKLLKALGNRPRGNQLILSAPVAAMYHFLILLGIFALAGFLKLFFGLLISDLSAEVFGEAVGSVFLSLVTSLILTGTFLLTMVRSLLRRQGMLASFWKFTLALIMLGFILLWQAIEVGGIVNTAQSFGVDTDTIMAINAIVLPMSTYVIGGIIMAAFIFFRRKDVMLWFPAKKA